MPEGRRRGGAGCKEQEASQAGRALCNGARDLPRFAACRPSRTIEEPTKEDMIDRLAGCER